MKYISITLLIIPALLSAMSIDEAVQKTIMTNPQIDIKKEKLYTEQELLTASKSDYLPSLDLSYSVGPESTKTINNKRERVDETRQEASVTLTQNIFAGFDTEYGVEQQKALIISAGEGVKETANSLAFETVTAYIDILKTKELLDIAKINIEVHKKYLSQIKEKVDAGVGRLSDYEQTLSRYENTRSTYLLNEQKYKNSFYNFQRILPGDIKISDLNKPDIGQLPAQDIDILVDMAFKNNPTIHLSQANINYARATLDKSNAPYYPSVDLKAQSYWNKNLNGYSKDNQGRTFNNDDIEENGYNALVVISYNIFNGLEDTSNIEANRHRLLQEQSTLVDSKRYIKADTKVALEVFESTKQQLVYIERNIEASAKTVSYYQEENELGRRSIIDLLNIELEYNAAQNRRVTAEYNHLLAYYQILTQTGKILETMSVTIE